MLKYMFLKCDMNVKITLNVEIYVSEMWYQNINYTECWNIRFSNVISTYKLHWMLKYTFLKCDINVKITLNIEMYVSEMWQQRKNYTECWNIRFSNVIST